MLQGLEKTLEDIRGVSSFHPAPYKVGKEKTMEAWDNVVMLSKVINKMCGKEEKA